MREPPLPSQSFCHLHPDEHAPGPPRWSVQQRTLRDHPPPPPPPLTRDAGGAKRECEYVKFRARCSSRPRMDAMVIVGQKDGPPLYTVEVSHLGQLPPQTGPEDIRIRARGHPLLGNGPLDRTCWSPCRRPNPGSPRAVTAASRATRHLACALRAPAQ